MIWMDVDVALSEVPVNVAPLTDDSDFKSVESAVAYNASGMALYWHFVTPDGNYTVTQVTPTTGGTYDWAHQNQGMYTIEIPASGGASINNNTEGWGFFTGYATGVLPWRGPTIGFRAAGLNNLLVEDAYSATRGLAGTALPNAAAEASGGLPTLSAAQASNGTINANVHRWLTGTPNALQSGRVDSYLGAAAAGVIAAATFAANALDAVWSTAARTLTSISDSSGITTLLARLTSTRAGYIDNLSGGAVALASQLGTNGSALSAIPWNTGWDTEVESEVMDALNSYDPPTATEMDARTLPSASYANATDMGTLASGIATAISGISTVNGKVDVIDGIVDTIVAKTSQLAFTSPGKVDANAMEVLAAVANKLADHVLRRRMSNNEASADGDTLHKSSLYGLMQMVQESSNEANPGECTIFKTDGVTELGRITIGTDPDAEPITRTS
jgi:hypothetical protein